ncbi:MAG: type 1 periplasmic binding fold superfamily protein [Verrucomicrobia bacterium]|nr:type 1 periplasmic binding fold superfamily protein [Cytophagales bacterium]
MKKIISKVVFSVSLLGILALNACKNNDPQPDEQEQITTLTLSLVKAGTTTPISITFRDADGEGGNAPTTTPATLVLDANATYGVTLSVLDETKSPVENITEEIEEEKDDHQFYFAYSANNLTVNIIDTDSKNLPVGLISTFTTTSAGVAANLTVTLKHKPGSKAANDPVSKGETDIEVVFPVQVQ